MTLPLPRGPVLRPSTSTIHGVTPPADRAVWRAILTARRARAGTGVAVVAATLSLAAAAIHFTVVAEHAQMSWIHGLGFALVAWFQALWAVAFAIRPALAIRIAGVAVNLAIVAAWAASRTVGLPDVLGFGPPEPPGTADLAATAFEIGLVMLLLRPDRAAFRRPLHRPIAPAAAGAVLGVAWVTALVITLPRELPGAGHGRTADQTTAAGDPAVTDGTTHETANDTAGEDTGHAAAPEPPGRTPGVVTFGLGLDESTLEITGVADFFYFGDVVAWRADFLGPIGDAPVVMRIAKATPDGVGPSVWSAPAPAHNPALRQLAARADLSAFVARKPGHYVLRYIQGDTILAEGAFTIEG